MCGSVLRSLRTAIACVHKGDFDHLTRRGLHLLGQCSDLGAVLRIRGRNHQPQQMAQRIDRDVDFAPLFAFGPIVARACATFRRRLQGATIQNRRTRVRSALLQCTQPPPQVLRQRRKDARLPPALGLLLHRVPGRQSVWQHPPRRPRPHPPPQSIAYFP